MFGQFLGDIENIKIEEDPSEFIVNDEVSLVWILIPAVVGAYENDENDELKGVDGISGEIDSLYDD